MMVHIKHFAIATGILLVVWMLGWRTINAWKDVQVKTAVRQQQIKENDATAVGNAASFQTAQGKVNAGTVSNAQIDQRTAAELANVKAQLATKPNSEEIRAMIEKMVPGVTVSQGKDSAGNAVLTVEDTQANRDKLNQADAAFKTCGFENEGCQAKNKNFVDIIIPAKDSQIQALSGTIAAQTNTISLLRQDVKDATKFGKAGNIWSRTGRVLLPIGCAGAGAWLGSTKGTRGAAVGSLAGGSMCALTFH